VCHHYFVVSCPNTYTFSCHNTYTLTCLPIRKFLPPHKYSHYPPPRTGSGDTVQWKDRRHSHEKETKFPQLNLSENGMTDWQSTRLEDFIAIHKVYILSAFSSNRHQSSRHQCLVLPRDEQCLHLDTIQCRTCQAPIHLHTLTPPPLFNTHPFCTWRIYENKTWKAMMNHATFWDFSQIK